MARDPRLLMDIACSGRQIFPVPMEDAAVLAAVKTKPAAAQVGRS
jgi:hypothetical protein